MKILYNIGLYIELPNYNTPISCICQGVRNGKLFNIYKIVTNLQKKVNIFNAQILLTTEKIVV